MRFRACPSLFREPVGSPGGLLNRLSRGLLFLSLFFLLLSIALEFPGSRRVTEGDPSPRYSGSEPWAVEQVRPGEPAGPHGNRLGPPQQDVSAMGSRILKWSQPEVILTVDDEGAVREVWGKRLTAGSATLVWPGASSREVEAILGRGRVEKTTRPRGGVISLGSVEVARILIYENADVRFEITLEDDQVRHIRARAVSGDSSRR